MLADLKFISFRLINADFLDHDQKSLHSEANRCAQIA
jgi:hypothetical protein